MSRIEKLSHLHDGEPIKILDCVPLASTKSSSFFITDRGPCARQISPENNPELYRYRDGHAVLVRQGKKKIWYFLSDDLFIKINDSMILETRVASARTLETKEEYCGDLFEGQTVKNFKKRVRNDSDKES